MSEGLGAGIAFNPMLIVALSDVEPERSGLASGLVNTSFMMGGALGLAILASLAAARTNGAIASGVPQIGALNDGYHAAFAVVAVRYLPADPTAMRAISPRPLSFDRARFIRRWRSAERTRSPIGNVTIEFDAARPPDLSAVLEMRSTPRRPPPR